MAAIVVPAPVAALGSALAWAGLDALRKSLAADVGPSVLVFLFSVAQLPFFLAWAAVEGGTLEPAAYAVPGLVCVALNIGANLLFVRAMQVSALSSTIPFLAFTPAFAAAFAIPLLGELPRATQAGGIALVIAGAFVLTWMPGSSPLEALRRDRGALMMLGVAAQWAATISLDKLAIEHAPLSIHATVQVAGVGIGAFVAAAATGSLSQLSLVRRRPVALLLTAIAGVFALGLQLVAVTGMLVGVVETLKRAIGLASAVVLGRLLFDEPITGRKVAAVAVMGLGSALIMLGAAR